MENKKPNQQFAKLASAKDIEVTMKALKKNGIHVFGVDNSEEARKEVLAIIPKGAEVFTMTSITLDTIGVTKEINESGKYNLVRQKLNAMDRNTQKREMAKLGAAPEWVVGSVHAITQDGQVMIASNTGSQLPAYAASAGHVIWVVGAQKIVKNLDEGFKRIYDYSYPLEDERAQKAYGMRSGVSKILIINKEVSPDRVTVIIVREKLGY